MGQLLYQATSVNSAWLNDNEFVYSRAFSDEDDKVYIRRFPVYKWDTITTLVAEMRLHTIDNIVTIDVYDGRGFTRGIYAPFYYEADYCHGDLVYEITQNIDKECQKLGMEKIEKE